MKTKTIGGTIYIVKKYYVNAEGRLDCIMSSWRKKKLAFDDCKTWREKYGEDEAYVFKAKQCIEL